MLEESLEGIKPRPRPTPFLVPRERCAGGGVRRESQSVEICDQSGQTGSVQ